MAFIGIDLHQNSITVCRLEANDTRAFETLTLSPADMERLCLTLFSAREVVEIEVLREQALSLSARVDREIETIVSTFEGHDGLISIKGVGPRLAAVLLSTIGNVHDFASADKLAAYFGIVPRVSQSNETDHRGRITKRGNRLVRATLVQCTLGAIRYSSYLKSYHTRAPRLRQGDHRHRPQASNDHL